MTTRAKTVKPAAAATKEVMETVVARNKEAVESVMKVGTEAAQEGYTQALIMTKDQLDKASTQLFSVYDEATSFSKGNVEAFIAAGNIFAKGLEDMSKTAMGYYQSNVENGVDVAKSLMGCKTLREVVDLQTDIARSNFDNLVNETTKMSEMALKVANETMEPIQARANTAMNTLLKPMAA